MFHKRLFHNQEEQQGFLQYRIYQSHEQNNKLAKIDGGVIGILENESALITWAVSGPVIADILQDLDEDQYGNDFILLHHENTENSLY